MDENPQMEEPTVLDLLPKMPQELQDRIFEFCDRSSLMVLCQLNKEWYERSNHLLWRDIDFVDDIFDEDEQVELSRRFFSTCGKMMDENPERWAILCPSVRSLHVGRVHGPKVVNREWDHDDYIYFDTNEGRNIFDVIACLTNLQSLSVYIKNWWGGTRYAATRKALKKGLTKLESLKIGGQVSTDFLLGLLGNPQNIQHLSVINLIHSPGQVEGPDGVLFLSKIHDKFTNLKTLHLCKLADLDGRPAYRDSDVDEDDEDDEDDYPQDFASRMRWKFPRESEVAVLEEWVSLLRSSSGTLEELVVENRFLCGGAYDEDTSIMPGVTHPPEYGAWSIRKCQEALFPTLTLEWPMLQQLIFIGMGQEEQVNEAVSHLKPRVEVKQCTASIQTISGDATPDQISTPPHFAEDYEYDNF